MAEDREVRARTEGALREPALVPLYTVYVEWITEHYNLSRRQFQLYFGVNAGLIGLFGFIAKPAIEACLSDPGTSTPSPTLKVLAVGVPILGFALSGLWLLVMVGARRWQLLFNGVLGAVEMLDAPRPGLLLPDQRRVPTPEAAGRRHGGRERRRPGTVRVGVDRGRGPGPPLVTQDRTVTGSSMIRGNGLPLRGVPSGPSDGRRDEQPTTVRVARLKSSQGSSG